VQFKRQRELKRTKIEIIPMIDTMFFLLVFFMLSSLALARLNGFPVNLPRASTAPKQAAAELTITIDKSRQVFVNKVPVTSADLGTVLVQKAGGPNVDLANATVIMNCDTFVPHGLFVKCIDEARGVGITHFAIATAPEYSGKSPG
jgi:biopolymer transport protein ExbD